ncbi:PocR ligand-binding domain-containing protein [Aestuariimicrobium sp. p3-SID1156]|uniref:PocR ligand-binding domain-containing protein n=1 Tax=Aestuariimicrobium sp. p3-SID1156 TaxID=2916038 RepID=UPI00223BE32D|nr:PocR ligand-binding domain-containing protein [Aestuariimicrobium sp. p3-SID1156]MCT1458334.1 PocR ligand-binding domain-containing protein [Aestuariimicrobium sp. p3-SID1156]
MPGKLITELVPLEQLQQVQDQFAMAMGLAAILVDYRGKPVTSASGFTDFCSSMRADDKRRADCMSCDAHGGLQGAMRAGPHIYLCHAGLVDFSIPLLVGEDYLGAMMCGQVRLPTDETHSLPTVAVYGPTTLSDDLRRQRDAVPVMSISRVRAAADTLNALMKGLISSATSAGEASPTPLRAEVRPVPPRSSRIETSSRRLDVVALRRAFNDDDLPRAVAIVRQQLDRLFKPEDGPQQKRIGRDLLHESADGIWAIAQELDADAAAEVSRRINQERSRSRTHVTRYEAEEHLLGLLFCMHASLEHSQGRRARTLNDLINHIERNPVAFLTLQQAAEFMNLSQHHLSRTFKAQTGRTFIDYVTSKRIARAKYLLLYSDQPVLRIAADLRFRPANYFSRSFKAYIGLTPSEFRRGHTETPESVEDSA